MPAALSVSGQLLCERLLTDTRMTRSLRRPLFTLEPSAPASREASTAQGSSGGHAPETGPVRPTSAPICGRVPEAALGSGPWACTADLREVAGPGASALEMEQRSEDEALCGQRVGAPPSRHGPQTLRRERDVWFQPPQIWLLWAGPRPQGIGKGGQSLPGDPAV